MKTPISYHSKKQAPNKELFHPDELFVPVVPSYSYFNEAILKYILKLYIPAGRFELDPTYSKGIFYKGEIPDPDYKYDLNPVYSDVVKADCRELPHRNETINSIMFDPPFLLSDSKNNKGKIKTRFTTFKNKSECIDMYTKSLGEFCRILRSGGYLIFKCQDTVSSKINHFLHIDVYSMAINIGFKAIDLFILLAKNRLLNKSLKNQQHARKYHCYFWVFRK